MQDLRVGLRLLWKDKGFTITAALTLAACLGANTALFAVVDHVLLRPLRIPDSDRVLLVYNSYPRAGIEHAGATVPDYIERQRDITVFDEQALFNTRDLSLGGNGEPERIHTMQVTPSFFRLVRVLPRFGRTFSDEEGEIGKNHEVILSYGLWQRRLGGREALGQNVRIDGELFTVVGVMPADFVFVDSAVQAWVPLAFTDDQKKARYANTWAYLGRLKPGSTLARAQSQLDALGAANLERFPETKQVVATTGLRSVAIPLQDDLVRDVRSMLYLLWVGALFVLLIGCVNIVSLVIVRARVRVKELATRMALGAGPWRIVRQLVTEHMLLAMIAAVGGLLVAQVALRLMGAIRLEELPRGAEIQMDGVIVAYTLVTAAVIGLVLGAIPVVAGLPVNLTTILREEGRSGTSGRGIRTLRRALVVVQVAVAFVLLIGAGLLIASFRRVLSVDPGFQGGDVWTAAVNLPPARYADEAARRRFADDALRALGAIPGVATVGATTVIPLGDNFFNEVIFPEGHRLGPADSLVASYYAAITPGYFEAMRVRLVSGRFFDDRDTPDSVKTVIVDERLARRYWPGLDPVGRRMYEPEDEKDLTAITDKTQWYTVVGVVGEVKVRGLVEGVGETGAFYMAQAHRPARRLTFAIRTAASAPSAIAGAVRREIARLDPELPVFDEKTMAARIDRSLVTRRSPMLLAMACGLLALFLSVIGIYGVLAYLVSQRTKEIGIRIALGSSKAAVVHLVLREAVILIAGGLMVGAAGAAALTRSLESQLFGVRPSDPLVVSMAVAILGLAALAACAVPARRATRIDPAIVLAR